MNASLRILPLIVGLWAACASAQELAPSASPLWAPPRVMHDPQVQGATHVAPRLEPAALEPTAPPTPLPLSPPKSARRSLEASPTTAESPAPTRVAARSLSWWSVLGSLTFVLALFAAGAWALRRGLPAGAAVVPSEVVEVLGRVPLAHRQQAQLLRVGNKLLLVSLFPGGAEPLTEVTDPDEVQRLIGLCRAAQTQSASAAFRQALAQFQQQPARGFLPAQTTSRVAGPSVAAAIDAVVEDDGDDV